MWDVSEGRLLLVDIQRRLLYSVRKGALIGAPIGLSERVTAIVPAERGEWLAVFDRSIGVIDLHTGTVDAVLSIPGDAELVLNDAVSGRDGILYVGSVDRSGADRGELYAISSRLEVTTVLTGIGASNGLDTTEGGEKLVHVDSLGDRVSLGIDGPAISVPHPDGVAVDAEGYVWVALWGHGQVHRFDPAGRLDRVLDLPTPLVTNVAFGGADLDELFITTARADESGLGGAVFHTRPGVRGLPPAHFRWTLPAA